MIRILTVLLAVIAVAGAVFTALPFYLSSTMIGERIASRALELTGGRLSFSDEPAVKFWPYLGIEIDSVILEDPAAGENAQPIVRMEKLTARLNPLSALFGAIEINRFQLVRPRFSLSALADDNSVFGRLGGSMGRALENVRRERSTLTDDAAFTQPQVTVRLGQFEIVDGSIDYADGEEGANGVVTNINANINWPGTNSPLAITGDSIWRGEAINYSFRTLDAMSLMAGASAPIDFSVDSGALAAQFQGQANTIADLHLSGDIRFTSPSIRRMSGFLGHELETGSTLAEFSMEGLFKGTIKQFQVTDAVIMLDGNRGRGVVQYSTAKEGKASITGTLAAEQFDISPYIAAVRQDIELDKAGHPGHELLEILNLDLRLSAAEATVGDVVLSDVAASITVSESQAVLNIGNAVMFGGVLVGEASLANIASGSDLQFQGAYSNIDTGLISPTLEPDGVALSGQADADIQIRSTGSNAKKLLENAWGSLRLSMDSGALAGVDFEALFDAATVEGETAAGVELAGQTTFSDLEGEIAFNGQSAWIRSLWFNGANLTTQITGRTASDLSAIALSVRMRRKDPQISPDDTSEYLTEDPGEVQVFVGGSLKTPLVTRIRAPEGDR